MTLRRAAAGQVPPHGTWTPALLPLCTDTTGSSHGDEILPVLTPCSGMLEVMEKGRVGEQRCTHSLGMCLQSRDCHGLRFSHLESLRIKPSRLLCTLIKFPP